MISGSSDGLDSFLDAYTILSAINTAQTVRISSPVSIYAYHALVSCVPYRRALLLSAEDAKRPASSCGSGRAAKRPCMDAAGRLLLDSFSVNCSL